MKKYWLILRLSLSDREREQILGKNFLELIKELKA
jgi:hypothetical protein